MNVTKTHENGKIVVAVKGKINTSTSQQFSDALMPVFDEAKDIVLDFSEVVYIASTGLRVILTGYEAANAKGAKMVMRGVLDEVMKVFEMTGFIEFLEIE